MTGRPNRRWTKAQEQNLRKLWPTVVTGKQLQAVFGKDLSSICEHARRIGLRNRRVVWYKEGERIMAELGITAHLLSP